MVGCATERPPGDEESPTGLRALVKAVTRAVASGHSTRKLWKRARRELSRRWSKSDDCPATASSSSGRESDDNGPKPTAKFALSRLQPRHSNPASPSSGFAPDMTNSCPVFRELAGLEWLRSRQDVHSRYKFGRVLGVGTFSIVKLAVDVETGREWACKVIPLSEAGADPIVSEDLRRGSSAGTGPSELSSGGMRARQAAAHPREQAIGRCTAADFESSREEIMHEIELLSKLQHKNIMHIREFFEQDGKMYLITELMAGGELLRALMTRGSFAEDDAREVFKQMMHAIAYMNEAGIVHRDIKLENLMLIRKDDTSRIKIADFGLATYATGRTLTTVCGTPQYVAPEVLRSSMGTAYGPECDVWSAGVVLFNMLSGYPPFHAVEVPKLLQLIAHGLVDYQDPVWEIISPGAIDLVEKLLCANPNHRLTVQQALDHPWVRHL